MKQLNETWTPFGNLEYEFTKGLIFFVKHNDNWSIAKMIKLRINDAIDSGEDIYPNLVY